MTIMTTSKKDRNIYHMCWKTPCFSCGECQIVGYSILTGKNIPNKYVDGFNE